MYNLSVLQSSFVGAIAISDMVKSTLGPKGMVRFHLRCRFRCNMHEKSPSLAELLNKICGMHCGTSQCGGCYRQGLSCCS